LRTPTSVQSRRGLDWTNFFVADVQTGFGTFVAFYLAPGDGAQPRTRTIVGAGHRRSRGTVQ
jgi:hypothetical protein